MGHVFSNSLTDFFADTTTRTPSREAQQLNNIREAAGLGLVGQEPAIVLSTDDGHHSKPPTTYRCEPT